MVLQWDRQERLRVIIGGFVKLLYAGEVEFVGAIGVPDINELSLDRGGGRDIIQVRVALGVGGLDIRKVDLNAGRATHGDIERIIPDNLETEAAVVLHQIERSAVGIGKVLCRQQDLLHQAIVIELRGERDTQFNKPQIGVCPLLRRVCLFISHGTTNLPNNRIRHISWGLTANLMTGRTGQCRPGYPRSRSSAIIIRVIRR